LLVIITLISQENREEYSTVKREFLTSFFMGVKGDDCWVFFIQIYQKSVFLTSEIRSRQTGTQFSRPLVLHMVPMLPHQFTEKSSSLFKNGK